MSDDVREPEYEVVWPLARTHDDEQPTTQADRLTDLSGRKVGFIWDNLFNGDEIFDAVKAEMEDRYTDVSFVGWETYGNIHAANEDEIVAELPLVLHRTGVDAVVVGVGA